MAVKAGEGRGALSLERRPDNGDGSPSFADFSSFHKTISESGMSNKTKEKQ